MVLKEVMDSKSELNGEITRLEGHVSWLSIDFGSKARERTHLFCANQMELRLPGDAKEPSRDKVSG